MPEFTKLATVQVILTANAGPSLPPLGDYLSVDGENGEDDLASQDFIVTYMEAQNEGPGSFVLASYQYTSAAWGVVKSEPIPLTTEQAPDFIQYSNLGYKCLLDDNVAGDYTAAIFGMSNFFDNQETTGVALTFDLRQKFTAAFVDWNFKHLYSAAQFDDFGSGMISTIEYDADPGTFYTFAAIFDFSNFMAPLRLVNAYSGPIGFFPKGNFSANPGSFNGPYITVGSNTNESGIGIQMVTWTPGDDWVPGVSGNWRDGAYNDTWETITFDDPAIQADIDADNFYIQANRQSASPSCFFIPVYGGGGGDYTYVLEVFPLDQTYNVLIFEPNPLIPESVDLMAWLENVVRVDEGIEEGYIVYSINDDDIPYYGNGMPVIEPTAPLAIPRYTPVRLPCIVSCIPVIDKRK